jgi:hypothetical protein
VRGLVGLVLAACLIGLAGPQPVHAADEAPTPGLWINPELGLATPEEAERLLTMPFHAWYFDGDPWIQQKHRWRERVYLIYERPSWLTLKAGESWAIETCKDLLIAKNMGLALVFDPDGKDAALLYPKTVLGWRWAYHAWYYCQVLSHVARLQPIEIPPPGQPDFVARVWTVRHLSPLAYAGFSIESVCKAYRSEVWNAPHLAIQNRGGAYGGGHVFHGVFHRRRWDPALGDGDRVWALWAQDPTVEVAGIKISPRIRLESEESNYFFTVRGVGSLPGGGRPVFVVSVTNSAKNGGTMSVVYETLVLAYDAEIEMFRAINLEDIEHYFRHYNCLPSKRK